MTHSRCARRGLALLLAASACALPAAVGASVGGSHPRVILLGKQQVLVLAGTRMRCLLDLDYDRDDRPVGVRCLVANPEEEAILRGTGIPPQAVAGSYAVHATYWGAALLTRAKRSAKSANGVTLAYEEIVARRKDTLRTAPRRYGIFLQRVVFNSNPLRRTTVRLGDFVRFAGTKLMCSFARSTKGVPTVACLLVDANRTPISGAHGLLLADTAAAIAVADATRGLHPLVIREHGR